MIEFFKAQTPEEREAINVFLTRHNQRDQGSVTGYVASYYAAVWPGDDRPLIERMVAAAKFCPLQPPGTPVFCRHTLFVSPFFLQPGRLYAQPASRPPFDTMLSSTPTPNVVEQYSLLRFISAQ